MDREGNTYERTSIEQWLTNHNTSPPATTKEELISTDLVRWTVDCDIFLFTFQRTRTSFCT